MIIDYVPASQIYPYNAKAFAKQQRILIRNDISGQRLLALLSHERYHLQDTSTNVLYREVKANVHSALNHPAGFILGMISAMWHLRQTVDYINWAWRSKP